MQSISMDRRAAMTWSVARLLEIPQVRRLLALLCGHEKAVRAYHVVVFADSKMEVGFGAVLFRPFGKDVLRVAPVVLCHRPGTRECVVNHGDLVMGDVRIGLVDVKAFLDDGLVVPVQRNAS